jgi:cell division protein FtsQ
VAKQSAERGGLKLLVAGLDRALGFFLSPLAKLLPRRVRRLAEKIERERTRPFGQMAAAGFLLATMLYGLVAGGQIWMVGDSLLVVSGFGIDDVRITGHAETAELAILEKLELNGSLIWFDVAEAQERVAALPWVERAVVRKFYPSTLEVEIQERTPFALWQREGQVFVMDASGTEIVPLEDARFAKLPFMVGATANEKAAQFFLEILAEPEIAEQMRAAVFVAGRRWDLHLENGVTIKLPEKDMREALAQLVKLNAERQLLARDVIVVDLRLPDRITVRLPEGRSMEEITTEGAEKIKTAKART